MTHNRAELLKQFLITAIKSDDDKIVFTKGAVKDMWLYICCLEGENEFYNKKLKERQAEIEEARIGVKSYKGKYESAVETVKELQTVIAEKDATIKGLQRLLYSFLDTRNGNVVRITDTKLEVIKKPIKAEAIKEFEKRFENKINEIDFPKYAVVEKMLVICKQMMNDIVKEMVGEQG